MHTYTADDLLRVAKRFNNPKRTYLLVNPLQAKHLPVSPKDALRMMKTFGDMLAEKYPQARLVIGFAETATAIGAAVADSFSSQCVYIHTTRESVPGVVRWVQFTEEHSHAQEQSLAGDDLSAWISATDSVVFVDDELSTGKTLRNIVAKLKEQYPQLKSKTLVAASLLNRISKEDEEKLAEAGIVCEYLLKLPPADYAAAAEPFAIHEAPAALPARIEASYQALFCENFANPRKGVQIGRYKHGCMEMAETFLAQFVHKIQPGSSILVLGTEECMYPALVLGAVLEEAGSKYTVRCHATTRSPIGICTEKAYPISSGWKLKSFYDGDRPTYIYNLCAYDAVIVVSDTAAKDFSALESLMGALPNHRDTRLFYLRQGRHGWCVKKADISPSAQEGL